MKFHARDIIAGIALTGGLILLGMGRNGNVGIILIGVISYYFGHQVIIKNQK